MLKRTEQQLKSILRGPKYQLLSWRDSILPAMRRWENIQRTDKRSPQWGTKLAIYQSFAAASGYTQWSDWSLHPNGCLLIADLLMNENVKKVVEFGAGYSTIFLTKFIQQAIIGATIESFEHQVGFSDRLATTLNRIGNKVSTLHTCELIQSSDELFNQLFLANTDAQSALVQGGKPVPKSQYWETRLHNVFYNYDFSAMADHSIDLLILDGPNGNGRSIAFPLLKHKLKTPGWILIDDYLDHPYLKYLESVFSFTIVTEQTAEDNEFVLLQIHDPK